MVYVRLVSLSIMLIHAVVCIGSVLYSLSNRISLYDVHIHWQMVLFSYYDEYCYAH